MNIVAVDDEATIVTRCQKAFGAQGHQAQGFTSTRRALPFLAAGPTPISGPPKAVRSRGGWPET